MYKTFFLLITIILGYGNLSTPNLYTERPGYAENLMVQDILLGPFEKEDLMQKPYKKWFEPAYTKYSPNEDAMAKISSRIHDYDIKLFMGTWCQDSRRETPKFLKILDLTNYDMDKLEMIAVDYDKSTESQIEKQLDIIYVPTIIFYKNGEEVNRFVEYPQGKNFEADIAEIVTGEMYKNSYAD